jgi:hypothetical protein
MQMRSAGMMGPLMEACCSAAADSPRQKMDSSALDSSHLCSDKEGAHC